MISHVFYNACRVIWLASNASKRRAQDDNAAKKRPRIQSIFAVQPKGAAPMGMQPNAGYSSAAQVPPLLSWNTISMSCHDEG